MVLHWSRAGRHAACSWWTGGSSGRRSSLVNGASHACTGNSRNACHTRSHAIRRGAGHSAVRHGASHVCSSRPIRPHVSPGRNPRLPGVAKRVSRVHVCVSNAITCGQFRCVSLRYQPSTREPSDARTDAGAGGGSGEVRHISANISARRWRPPRVRGARGASRAAPVTRTAGVAHVARAESHPCDKRWARLGSVPSVKCATVEFARGAAADPWESEAARVGPNAPAAACAASDHCSSPIPALSTADRIHSHSVSRIHSGW